MAQSRDFRGGFFVGTIKHAFRTLFKTPFVTAVAIISLALGIGANAAIFSLFEQMLLRPLPVREPQQLVNLSAPGPKPGSQSCNQAGGCEIVFSYPMFRDLEAKQTVFTGLAAHRLFGANLAFKNQTLNGEGMMVSGSYFPLLGLQPAAGRLLGPADDQTIGGHFVAVLGYDYWQSRLGGDPGVVGQTMIVNGQHMTILGVAPEGFEGTTLGSRPRVYVPISMRGLMDPNFRGFQNRRSYWAYVFGRLKPGVTLDQATVGLNAIYKPIILDVEAPLQSGMSDQTMGRFKARQLVLEDGRRGQSSVHEKAGTPLKLLFGVTGIVLFIACANIANLLLARGANRAMEMAVRLSLGARRWQIVRQLLVESVILALLGGLTSLLVAKWTLGFMASIMPPEAAGTIQNELRPSVVAFAALLSVVTGLIFGMFPALHSTRDDLITTMRANTGALSGARAASRFRMSLVTAQIALSMALLVSAGLFIKSLMNVGKVDLGIRTENVVTFGVSPELNAYTPARSQQLFMRIEEELAAVPGVTGVSAAMVPLLAGSNWGTDVGVEGYKSGPDIDSNSNYNEVGPNFFKTLGVPLISGREFTSADVAGAPKVAVVNEAFAKKFNLGRDAVGKRISDRGTDEDLDVMIIGLVRDAKYSEVKDEIPPVFFRPYRQDSTLGQLTFYARTALEPEPLVRTATTVVSRIDPDLPLENLKTLPQQVRENVFLDRMISTLSAAFAALATLLAAVGLYGVLAYTVAQRTREIGVRMALGANGGRVRMMVLRQVGIMTLVGGIIGIAAAIALGKAASSLLFGLEGNDPLVVITAAVTLALVAFIAGYIPARRASRVNPMTALRYE
jgi:predicted permease